MSIGGEDVVVKAGVSCPLPTAALIGWDVSQLMSLMGENRDSENVLGVMTRSQQRSRRETTPDPDELPTLQMGGENDVSKFDSSLFSAPGHSKPRSQKRANNRTHDGYRTQALDPPMGVSSDELRRKTNPSRELGKPPIATATPLLATDSSAEAGYSTAGIVRRVVTTRTKSSSWYCPQGADLP